MDHKEEPVRALQLGRKATDSTIEHGPGIEVGGRLRLGAGICMEQSYPFEFDGAVVMDAQTGF